MIYWKGFKLCHRPRLNRCWMELNFLALVCWRITYTAPIMKFEKKNKSLNYKAECTSPKSLLFWESLQGASVCFFHKKLIDSYNFWLFSETCPRTRVIVQYIWGVASWLNSRIFVLKACEFVNSKSDRELGARIKILPLSFLKFTAIFCALSKWKVIINFVSDSSAFFPPMYLHEN